MGLKPRVSKRRKSRLDGLQSVKRGWRLHFHEGTQHLYPCPSCERGHLSPDKATFQRRETPESLDARSGQEPDDYEAVHYEYRFAGLLVCSDASCRAVSSISGRLEHTNRMVEYDTDFGQTEETRHDELVYHPESIVPAPRLFALPKTYPATVTTELDRAFMLFWVDAAACANSIRCALELLLTSEGVARFPRKGKRVPLNLGGRIRAWADGKPERATLAKAFDAARWIGNEGSHAGKLTRDDLFDGFDLLRHALRTIHETDPHERGVEQLATKITRRRRPRSQHKAS